MSKPNIAVFGAGLIGSRHILQANQQAQLCAIVDPSKEAVAVASGFDVALFATPEDCLNSIRPDGVVVATPNHLHADQAILCLEAGIPVLIEKPMAETLRNADRIVAASERMSVPVLVGHHRRHNPIIARAKAAIEANMLGDIVAVNGQFWLYKPDDYFDAAWRKGPGAGPTMINLIHDIDLLRYLCGEIVEVQAMRSNAARGGQVEDTAAVMMRFASGALGTFSVSDSVVAPWSWEMTSGENPIYPNVPQSCYTIGGTQSGLSIPDLQLWTYDGPRSWWNQIGSATLKVERADAFAIQFKHFIDVIKGAAPLVSAAEGRASLAAVLKVVESNLGPET
ncbi:MAG: Gfo/Idh/MocA family oxidoreductase [Octadecabacter sp.]|nr:Gfo/Idh/MocA family oxidoreductase [Octadecabacter sp.]